MPVQAKREARVKLYPFSSSVLEGVGGQCLKLAALSLGNSPDTHYTGSTFILITNYTK